MASDLQVRGEIFRVKHANLSVPEGAVGFRAGVALGAAVPKTAVDEDGDLLLWTTRCRAFRVKEDAFFGSLKYQR